MIVLSSNSNETVQLKCQNTVMGTFLKLAIPGRNNQLTDRDENEAFAIIDAPAGAFFFSNLKSVASV